MRKIGMLACVAAVALTAWCGTWEKYERNPVLGSAKLGTCFDVNVVTDGPAPYTMYFSWRPQKAIALVRSDDAMQWTQAPEICLQADPTSGWEDDLNRSCTVRKDGVWHMWYTGQAKGGSKIGYATSTDGVRFTRVRREPVMVPEHDFEKLSVMNPYVRWDAARKVWRMWYAAGETYEPNVLCYAESADGLSWKKWDGNPMFGKGAVDAWDRDRVGACEVHPLPDGRWAMFYIGYSDVDTARIGCAISEDGVTNWRRLAQNPIVAPDLCTWDSSACYKPSVVRDEKNGRWLLWYNGRNGAPEYIGCAIHEGLDLEAPSAKLPDTRALLSTYVRRFNSKDDELYTNAVSNAQAEEFMLANCPRFACPDKDIERTYYFRWWTFRKHLRKRDEGRGTRDEGEWVVTEFLPKVPWSGPDNTIVCPAGHHLREGRWLRDPKFVEDNARFWLADPRATHRWNYSSWLFTGACGVAEVTGHDGLPVELLDAAVAYYRRWEQGFERSAWPEKGKLRMGGDGKGGFTSIDNYEGTEISLGGSGYKPLMSSAMWSEANAIANVARKAGRDALAKEFAEKAEVARRSMINRCWNPEVGFFTTEKRDDKKGVVRELHGYAPWYFGLPTDGREADWAQLADPQGFAARYGLTFPERRAKGFQIAYTGHECQWNGPSWPFATSVALTAYANDLHARPERSPALPSSPSPDLFTFLLWQYASQQKRTHPMQDDDWTVQPWIDENAHPDKPEWLSREIILKTPSMLKSFPRERGKDYNHSTFCDLVISGLVGFVPNGADGFAVDPLFPATWDYLILEDLRYRSHDVAIRWQRGRGLVVTVDGREAARRETLGRLVVSFAADTVAVDFGKTTGPVKPVNGIGQPPMVGMPINAKMFHYLKEAGIPHSRLHDVGGWQGQNRYVDIPNVFRDFDADENDPKNYSFDYTDILIKNLVENGVEPFYRLGVTIENPWEWGLKIGSNERIVPPKDFAKWARICEHVIRHYTEGWANGFRYKIAYWEIWNEPDNRENPAISPLWQAPFEEYIRFYGVVATYLKAKFPDLKIGGYGCCGFYDAVGASAVGAAHSSPRTRHFIECAQKFLKAARDNRWPLDFFSYHSYSDAEDALKQVSFADRILNDYGFTADRTERIFNEWLPAVAHENLGTAKQAAQIAAEVIGLQNGPCDVACIYDGRCGIGDYSPLFNPLTYTPHKAYYVFKAFNELRKLGTAVKAPETPKGVYLAAATDGKDASAVLVANVSGRAWRPVFDFGDRQVTGAKVIDAARTYETVGLPDEIANESVWLIVLERKSDPCAEVRSPDGCNRIALWTDPLAYAVTRDGVTVVAKSAIGLTADGKPLAAEKAPDVSRRRVSGTVATPIYKKASVDLTAVEAFADFGEWGVRLQARNDGVAYRFETKRAGTVRIDGETADVAVPDPEATCWVNFTGAFGCEETTNATLKAREILTTTAAGAWDRARRFAYLPLTYAVGGKTVCVTESDVFDYPIWNFTRGEDGASVVLKGTFARWPTAFANNSGQARADGAKRERNWQVTKTADYLVETAGTRTYPWRTFVLADAPMKLIEADIVTALARPADPAHDFSWVKPGKVAWDWWNAFDNKGDPQGCTTETYRRFIDFAAKRGVEYVIFDEGWSEKLNIWKFHPRVDVPALIDYANGKGVGIILWMAWAQIDGDEARVAAHFAKLGAKGFKVDFMDRGDAGCERFLWTFAEECRKNRMLLDYHGAHRPTGMSRAYPNVLNYEGIRGLEMMKPFRGEYDFLDNDVKEMFCRMVAGPADYTPGAMDNYVIGRYRGTSDNPGSIGTRCRQVAMMVLYDAPLQMLCDAPTKYERNLECFDFMARVPQTWDATVALDGTPDTMAALARRSGGAWYAAGMTNAKARRYALDTSFLGKGEWQAEIFRDAADADIRPTLYVHETRKVAAGDRLAVDMAPGGGFAVRFTK